VLQVAGCHLELGELQSETLAIDHLGLVVINNSLNLDFGQSKIHHGNARRGEQR
jgi:hypothetical protein